MTRLISLLIACTVLCAGGCIGQAIETTTDAVIAVGKVPFKVGGAVVDVVTGDEDDDDKSDDK